jgi:hypothetical protein
MMMVVTVSMVVAIVDIRARIIIVVIIVTFGDGGVVRELLKVKKKVNPYPVSRHLKRTHHGVSPSGDLWSKAKYKAQRGAMNPYPFGLNDTVNEGARKTSHALYQKSTSSKATYIKALQDLFRLSVRDGLPVLLTGYTLLENNLHMKQQLRSVHGINAPCGGPRLA